MSEKIDWKIRAAEITTADSEELHAIYEVLGIAGNMSALDEIARLKAAALLPLRAREEIARIIDPVAFEIQGTWMELPSNAESRQTALQKADAILSSTAGQEWRDISSAPPYSSPNARVWVIGGRYTKPATVVPDGEYWRSLKGDLKLLPTRWAPCDPPPLPAPPVAEPLLAEKQTP
jgi:hypothetical protein